jgi:hypothetical protein
MLKWGLIAQIIPVCFAIFVSFYLLQKTRMTFQLAMPIAVAWGAIGASIHYLSVKRGMKFRLRSTLAFAVLTLGTGFGLAKAFEYDFSKFEACPVCGFVALEEKGMPCLVCKVVFDSLSARKEGYVSLDEYLTAAQLIYFQPSGTDTTVDFFASCNCPEAFPKASNWKPSVTAKDVREVQELAKSRSK